MKWKPLLAHIFPNERVLSTNPLSGGCINYCYRIETDRGAYFVKFNTAARYPGMYACESLGLDAMRSTKAVNVPKVLKQSEVEDMTYLVLEYIEPQPVTTKALEQLGHDLAMMHRSKPSADISFTTSRVLNQPEVPDRHQTQTQTQTQFGWPHDNYIGSIKQQNNWCSDWQSFYETQRILPLCNALVEEGIFLKRDIDACKRYLDSMHDKISIEPPSLLHGDLWSGNFIIGTNEKPYLIDPACYYGHREIDIALTQLFGGFGDAFLQAYHSTNPLADGWRQRLPYFQLYPLLVHAVIFGGSYVDSVRNIVYNEQ